jgi:tetratricopeptide (TPR) repeat protein
MQRTIATTALLAGFIAALALPSPAPAQTGTYYFPPKLIKQGKATSANAGAGTVVVKVAVNADGTFKVQDVIRSTNTGNNKAALEIAQTSKYKPAERGGKAIFAFYDFTLKFTKSSVSSVEEDTGGPTSGTLATYTSMLHAGKYADAKAGLTTYVADHPSDGEAQGLLGVADTYLKDYEGAVKAFDAAGTLSPKVAPMAADAYLEYATASGTDKTAAVDAAKKAVAYTPNVATYNALGNALQINDDPAGAAENFQKALDLAQSDPKMTGHNKAILAANLANAYAASGDMTKAQAAAAQSTKFDPTVTTAKAAVAEYYFKKGTDLEKAGKYADAAAQFEAGAQESPSDAVTLYTQAALVYLNMKPNADGPKAKAEADKALAIDPSNPRANFIAGVALADQGNSKDALTYLNKADGAAKAANDAGLADQIEAAIKQLSGAKS